MKSFHHSLFYDLERLYNNNNNETGNAPPRQFQTVPIFKKKRGDESILKEFPNVNSSGPGGKSKGFLHQREPTLWHRRKFKVWVYFLTSLFAKLFFEMTALNVRGWGVNKFKN